MSFYPSEKLMAQCQTMALSLEQTALNQGSSYRITVRAAIGGPGSVYIQSCQMIGVTVNNVGGPAGNPVFSNLIVGPQGGAPPTVSTLQVTLSSLSGTVTNGSMIFSFDVTGGAGATYLATLGPNNGQFNSNGFPLCPFNAIGTQQFTIASATISGVIIRPNTGCISFNGDPHSSNFGLPDATVQVSQFSPTGFNCTNQTAATGYYSCDVLPGRNYVVQPSYDGPALCGQASLPPPAPQVGGVNYLDFNIVMNFVLNNLQPMQFDAPWQYLAADANNDGYITTNDAVTIRKVILGIYTDFPINWKMVPLADYSAMFGLIMPPIPNYDSYLLFNNLPASGAQSPATDFVAIKTGDLDSSCKDCDGDGFAPSASEVRETPKSWVVADLSNKTSLKIGELLKVPIRSTTSAQCLYLSLGFDIDSDGLEIISAENASEDGLNRITEGGDLVYSYADIKQTTGRLQVGQPLLYLTVKAKKDLPDLLSAIRLDDQVLDNVWLDGQDRVFPLVFGEQTDFSTPAVPSVRLSPNPAQQELNLQAWMGVAENFQVELFNAQGTRIKLEIYDGSMGYLSTRINIEGLPHGVYYYKVVADGLLKSGSFIKQ